MISVKFDTKELNNFFEKADEELVNSMNDGLFIIANDLRNEIILSMRNTPRASWSYKRGIRRHYPSAPENPPAIDKGNLINSFVIDRGREDVTVGSYILDPPYPFFLELGTKKMIERPFAEPAIDKIGGSIEQNVYNALVDGMKYL